MPKILFSYHFNITVTSVSKEDLQSKQGCQLQNGANTETIKNTVELYAIALLKDNAPNTRTS